MPSMQLAPSSELFSNPNVANMSAEVKGCASFQSPVGRQGVSTVCPTNTCAILASCACACSSDLRWRESPQHVVATWGRTVQEAVSKESLSTVLVHHFMHQSLGAYRCSQDFHPFGVPDLESQLRHPKGTRFPRIPVRSKTGRTSSRKAKRFSSGLNSLCACCRASSITKLNNNGIRGSPCSPPFLAWTMRWCTVLIFPHETRGIGVRCSNKQKQHWQAGELYAPTPINRRHCAHGACVPTRVDRAGPHRGGWSGFALADT